MNLGLVHPRKIFDYGTSIFVPLWAMIDIKCITYFLSYNMVIYNEKLHANIF
jgi:hypothetical protein